MSCNTQKYVIINKFIIEQMINYTKDLHNRIFRVQQNITLKNILEELYLKQKNSNYNSYEKQHYSTRINEMCDYVHMKCKVTKTKIYETWLNVVLGGVVEVTSIDNEIINHIKNFIFGNVQTYQMIFEHNDKKTGKGRYYYVIKIEFDDKDKIKMFVSIQDLNNSHHPYLERGLSMITNSSLTDDGFITFDVSDKTLLDLAKFTYNEFNNSGFSGGFELYPHISLINNNSQEYVNEFIAYSQFNIKFLDLLIPF